MWICSRPINAWYGSVLPDHQYVCCEGANKQCYGHRNNDLEKGDPIPPEPDSSGTCEEVDVSKENKEAHCDAPTSPCNAGTFTWNCRDWAQWDGVSSCPIWTK